MPMRVEKGTYMSKKLLAPGTAALLVSLGVGVALVAGNASAARGTP